MRLGDIIVRHELNPRKELPLSVIQTYARRLRNGDIPPPLVIHKDKGLLFEGYLRYGAWKDFFGKDWESQEVDVIPRKDLPDPDREPVLYRMMAAESNKGHGMPLSRSEKQSLAEAVADLYGEERALGFAKMLGETQDSMEEYFAKRRAAAQEAVSSESEEGAEQAEDDALALESGGHVRQVADLTQTSILPHDTKGYIPGLVRYVDKIARLLKSRKGAPLVERDVMLLRGLVVLIGEALPAEAKVEAA